MPDQPENGPSNLLPVITLVVIAALLLAGWLLFPQLQRAIHVIDCVASGRTDCMN